MLVDWLCCTVKINKMKLPSKFITYMQVIIYIYISMIYVVYAIACSAN